MTTGNPIDYKYSRDQPLGSGSFGDVYKGVLCTGEQVAVKTVKSLGGINLEALMTEKKILLSCRNAPNIVQIRSYNENSIAIELAECSLEDMIKKNVSNIAGLNQNVVKDLIHDLNTAVTFLQSENIAHRDIKPQNVLVYRKRCRNSGYIFKLGDMGSATEKNSHETLVGTQAFLVPTFCEALANGKRAYDKVDSSIAGIHIDAWTVGCTIFYACTSFCPFRVESENSTLKAIKNRDDGDISVVVNGKAVTQHKTLPHSQFDKWFTHATSKFILQCFELSQIKMSSEAQESFNKIADAIENAEEKNFISLKSRQFFKYADISEEHGYLKNGYPTLSQVFCVPDLSRIKLLSEEGVIEGNCVDLRNLKSDINYFVVPSDLVNEEPRSPSAILERQLENCKVPAMLTFCIVEFHRANRELLFMTKSIETIKRISNIVLNEGKTCYSFCKNTHSIVNSVGEVCSSKFFKKNELLTLQYFQISHLANSPIGIDAEHLQSQMEGLTDLLQILDENTKILKTIDVNLDDLNNFVPLESIYELTGGRFIKEKILETCKTMDEVYKISSQMQQLLTAVARSCVSLFNLMPTLKETHKEFISLLEEHNVKVKETLDQFDPKRVLEGKSTKSNEEQIKQLNSIAEKLNELTKNYS